MQHDCRPEIRTWCLPPNLSDLAWLGTGAVRCRIHLIRVPYLVCCSISIVLGAVDSFSVMLGKHIDILLAVRQSVDTGDAVRFGAKQGGALCNSMLVSASLVVAVNICGILLTYKENRYAGHIEISVWVYRFLYR